MNGRQAATPAKAIAVKVLGLAVAAKPPSRDFVNQFLAAKIGFVPMFDGREGLRTDNTVVNGPTSPLEAFGHCFDPLVHPAVKDHQRQSWGRQLVALQG